MTEPLLKEPIEEVREPAAIRRFELADLNTHGPWLLRRFATKFPDASEQHIAGYLRGLMNNNENMFYYMDNGVALAQLVISPGLKMTKLVQERFVWVKDKTDKEQLEDAAGFYDHMKQWAKWKEAERLIVCEDTDVPKNLIEARLGRIFDTKISHARV
jgi:hypothetical protein